MLGAGACGALSALAPSEHLALFTHAWCLHEVLCRQLPLAHRALRLPQPEAASDAAGRQPWAEVQAEMLSFIASLHFAGALLLEAASPWAAAAPADAGSIMPGNGAVDAAAPAGARQLDASLADWLDGRLMHLLVAALWEGRPLQLGARAQALLDQLQQSIQSAAAAFGGQSPLASGASNGGDAAAPATGSAGAGQEAAQPAPAAEPAAAEVKLLPVHSNALVEAVMAGDGHSGHTVLSVHELDSSEARLAMRDSSATYWGDHHFHTGERAVCVVLVASLLPAGVCINAGQHIIQAPLAWESAAAQPHPSGGPPVSPPCAPACARPARLHTCLPACPLQVPRWRPLPWCLLSVRRSRLTCRV